MPVCTNKVLLELFGCALSRYSLPSGCGTLIGSQSTLLAQEESLLAGARLLDIEWTHILLTLCLLLAVERLRVLLLELRIVVLFLARLVMVLLGGSTATLFCEHLLMRVGINCSLLELVQILGVGALRGRQIDNLSLPLLLEEPSGV